MMLNVHRKAHWQMAEPGGAMAIACVACAVRVCACLLLTTAARGIHHLTVNIEKKAQNHTDNTNRTLGAFFNRT